jgi:hypothetical protein
VIISLDRSGEPIFAAAQVDLSIWFEHYSRYLAVAFRMLGLATGPLVDNSTCRPTGRRCKQNVHSLSQLPPQSTPFRLIGPWILVSPLYGTVNGIVFQTAPAFHVLVKTVGVPSRPLAEMVPEQPIEDGFEVIRVVDCPSQGPASIDR